MAEIMGNADTVDGVIVVHVSTKTDLYRLAKVFNHSVVLTNNNEATKRKELFFASKGTLYIWGTNGKD